MRLKIKEALDKYNEKQNAQSKDNDFKLTMSALALIVFNDYELSDKMKIRYLSDMNVGKRRRPEMKEVVKIAETLEVSTDFLLDIENSSQ